MKLLCPLSISLLTAGALLIGGTATSHAAALGTDNVNQTAYDDGWQDGDDGSASGNAFSPWSLTTSTTGSGFAGHFIGDSTQSDGGSGGNINVNGESFGMFGGPGGPTDTGEANAFRSFVGGDGTTPTPLSVGQTFSIDIVVNFRNGFKGIDLRDTTDTTVFNFNIGGDDYVVNNAATGNGSIGNTYSGDTVFSLSFTQTSAGGGTWQIDRSGGVTDSDSGTYTGALQSIKLYVGNTDGGDANNLYANNLAIVPEPSALAMLFGGAGLMMLLRRRRR